MRDPLWVLVIGDEVEMAALMASLRGDGHRVDHARDVTAALRVNAHVGHDAVLVDLECGDGVLVRSLRTEVLPRGTSILAISNRAGVAPAEIGADLVLQRPLETVGLGSLVEYMTRQRRQAPR